MRRRYLVLAGFLTFLAGVAGVLRSDRLRAEAIEEAASEPGIRVSNRVVGGPAGRFVITVSAPDPIRATVIAEGEPDCPQLSAWRETIADHRIRIEKVGSLPRPLLWNRHVSRRRIERLRGNIEVLRAQIRRREAELEDSLVGRYPVVVREWAG